MANSLPSFTGNFQPVNSTNSSALRESQNEYGLIIRGDRILPAGTLSHQEVQICQDQNIYQKCVDFFCLLTDKMQQEDYDLWPHGLAGGLGTFLPGFSRLLGLKKQADAA